MDRYLLFAGDDYEPYGGWRDLKGSFPTIRLALVEAAAVNEDWFHIVDIKTGKIVRRDLHDEVASEEPGALSDHGLVAERPARDGIQRIYRWGDGGVSLVNHSMAYSPEGGWEAAVIEFPGESNYEFNLVYYTPLADDLRVFENVEETNEFLREAAEYWTRRRK